jgi:transposase
MKKDISVIVGLDVSDRFSQCCVADAASGEILEEIKVMTREASLRKQFAAAPKMRIVLETGTHSSWIARLLRELGHEVLVADARRLRFIYMADRKDDEIDARMLAKVGRIDPELLHPVRTRSRETDRALAVLRSRDVLVQARTKLVNSVRGQMKKMGHRLPRISTDAFAAKARPHLPQDLRPVLEPLLDVVAEITAKIHAYDTRIEALCEARPETGRLRQVAGVGAVTALAFVLVIEDPSRFAKSRQVGPYLGLTSRRDVSGETDRQLGITRAGDKLLRRLLVGSAHYILGPFGPDTDLRRWGLVRAAQGGGHGKKRVVVAVARRLAVLLHRLWVGGETYRPLRESSAAA